MRNDNNWWIKFLESLFEERIGGLLFTMSWKSNFQQDHPILEKSWEQLYYSCEIWNNNLVLAFVFSQPPIFNEATRSMVFGNWYIYSFDEKRNSINNLSLNDRLLLEFFSNMGLDTVKWRLKLNDFSVSRRAKSIKRSSKCLFLLSSKIIMSSTISIFQCLTQQEWRHSIVWTQVNLDKQALTNLEVKDESSWGLTNAFSWKKHNCTR